MQLDAMARTAERVSGVMRALSHPKRLLILCQLAEGERSVGELARLLEMKEPAMSQQLALMRREGLVTARRDGQTVWYALAAGEVRDLLVFLHDTYCRDGVENGA